MGSFELPLEQRYKEVLSRESWSTADELELRQLVIEYGIPEEEASQSCSGLLRGEIWKRLLRVPKLSAKRYQELNAQGKNPEFGHKIYNDTHRTLANDRDFEKRVSHKKIFRVLNAFANAYDQQNDDRNSFSYVQGMNALCAPLLYVLPELDAFYCFEVLMTQIMPTYMSKNLEGVQQGCQLLEKCLKQLDPELSTHLMTAGISAQVYAFAPLLTMSACCPPFKSLLPVWDIFMALGFHLNVLLQACQLVQARDELLSSNQIGSNRASWLSGRDFRTVNSDSLRLLLLTSLFRLDSNLVDDLRNHLKTGSGSTQAKLWATT